MAVTKCADKRPTRECSYCDVRHKVCDHAQHKRVIMGWIPGHRQESEARSEQEREQIRRNGEVDLRANMATRLPVPYCDPIRLEDTTVCGSLFNVVHGWFVASFGRQEVAVGLLGGFIQQW